MAEAGGNENANHGTALGQELALKASARLRAEVWDEDAKPALTTMVGRQAIHTTAMHKHCRRCCLLYLCRLLLVVSSMYLSYWGCFVVLRWPFWRVPLDSFRLACWTDC